MPWTRILLAVLCVIVLLQGTMVAYEALRFVRRYFLTRELNLPQRYGPGSWVVITGGSSGQGRRLAHEFAARGFHLLLIGSKRSHDTAALVRQRWPRTRVAVVVKDFGQAFAPGFFDEIEAAIEARDVSVVINNVGHRTGWAPYHEQPSHIISETIACGTIVQCRLTQIALKRFARRKQEQSASAPSPPRTALVFITAQCMHGNVGLGASSPNEITVPYLSVYEPTNAFGYYHACSIFQEYGARRSDALGEIDILNVTPGAVVTENTPYLSDTLFSIDVDTYVRNIMALLGNVQGTTCAHWGHSLATGALAICPWIKDRTLHKVGHTIAHDYMHRYRTKNVHAYGVADDNANHVASTKVPSSGIQVRGDT